MEYAYATLPPSGSGEPIDGTNRTAVPEAAGVDISESPVRALVATLEGMDPTSLPDAENGFAHEAVDGEGDRTDEHGDEREWREAK